MSIRIVKTACAIKGCLGIATSVVDMDQVEPADFMLCEQCETAVMIDNHVMMEYEHEFPAGTAKAFALVWNSWRRRHKGAGIAHRPQNLGFVKPLIPTVGES